MHKHRQHKFVKRQASIVVPLIDLLCKDKAWQRGDHEQHKFVRIKEALTSAPVVAMADGSKPFIVLMNAFGFALGAILMQDPASGPQPIAHYSRKLRAAKRNYATRDKEFLAMIHAF